MVSMQLRVLRDLSEKFHANMWTMTAKGLTPAGLGTACAASDSWKNAKTIYEFTVKDIDGNDVSLEKYRGHVCLIVNVACQCGFTDKNYTQLQALHTKYAESKGLRILVFPCNQFGGQEPLDEKGIKSFVTTKYGVQFDMFAKIQVNGSDAHPLYNFLKQQQAGFLIDAIKWNFTKFLVDKEGKPVKRYAPTVNPFDLEKDLEAYF